MVDILYTGTKAGEMMIAGLAGGFAFSVAVDGVPSIRELGLISGLFLFTVALVFGLHWWYERQRGEPFR